MAWPGRRKTYDRTRILAAARKAAKRGRLAKAISLYEQVREVEPENLDVVRRLAALRARAGQRDEAWADCHKVGQRLAERGFVEKALGVYRDFAKHLPREVDVWKALAELELSRERRADAVAVLLEGRGHLRARARRQDALALLHRARRIDATHFEANFDLAGLMARTGARGAARRVLAELERGARGRNLRRLRRRQFWFYPGPTAAWRWMTAVFAGT